jgi:adenylyl-sulfate kinase
MKKALVFWLSGLSGSGKTTLVDHAVRRLAGSGKRIRIFDGDVVRKEINRHLTFSPEDIRENNRIIADLCLQNIQGFDYIFVPVISPFQESRNHARKMLGGSFYLIYCKASLDEVIRRDPKGLYRKALSGELADVIGVHKHVPFEPPADADLVLDTENETLETCVGRFLDFIKGKEEALTE